MLDMGVLFDKPKNPQDFKSIKISIASPEQIKESEPASTRGAGEIMTFSGLGSDGQPN